jgi:hypothetical protein
LEQVIKNLGRLLLVHDLCPRSGSALLFL